MKQKPGRILLAHNDVCKYYRALKDETDSDTLLDLFAVEELDDISEDDYWEQAYRDMEANLECDADSLSEKIHHKIVAFGSITRWNGVCEIYPEIVDANSLGGIIEFCLQKFGGNNETFYLYDEKGRLFVHAYGHDNPTNPHVIEFRMLTDFGDEMWDSIEYSDNYVPNEELIEHHSEPIGRMIQKVFGYKYED